LNIQPLIADKIFVYFSTTREQREIEWRPLLVLAGHTLYKSSPS
jgi:hypothetical protein